MRGHIRQRGKNSWAIVVRVRDPKTGKSKPHWHTVKGSRKDAEKELTRILHQIDTNTYLTPSKMTVAEYLRKWLKRQEKRISANSLSANTWRGYRTNVENHIIPYLGDIRLIKLRAADVDDLFSEYLAEKDLSGTTLLYVFRTLNKALNDAVKREEINRNPVAIIERPRKGDIDIRVLQNINEVNLLKEALRETILYGPVMLILTTGLRRGEALGLRWCDLDFENRILRVKKQLTHDPISRKIKLTKLKTKTSNKPLKISKFTAKLLQNRKAEQEKERKFVGSGWRNKDSLVFTWPDGRKINPIWFSKAFKREVDRIGLSGLTPKGLRHSHATLLLGKNQNPKLIQEELRHSQIHVTMNTYSHVLPPMQEQLADCIDELFGEI
jgi:integrase